ncbi:MAG: ATP-binding protein [Acidobacteriota bacterium]
MRVRSLRRRLLISSLLWTVGLLFVSAVPFTLVMEQQSRLHIARYVHRFLQSPVVILTAVFCMIAGLAVARGGLASVDNLRQRLNGLRTGRERRMDGAYPAEVQPLVDDLNALLDHREQAIQRAIARSGDLAHGLKTPLAILAQEAQRARGADQHEIAAAIDQQVERMRRQVDYHLAQARAVASGATAGARSSVVQSADGLARALLRVHAERCIAIDVQVAGDVTVRAQREDLDEMLGNLMDNACKWARATVVVSIAATDAGRDGPAAAPPRVTIVVDDDGDGIVPGLREAVLQRGVRADEAAPGSGLGLAIVSDLAELYGGSIHLEASPRGGVRAKLSLPRLS